MRQRSHPRRGRLLAAAGLALAAAFGLAAPSVAHALLVSSEPAAGANLPNAPTQITLTFTEVPDPRLSTIKVLNASGVTATDGTASAVPGSPTKLRVSLGQLKRGVYTVAWRTVSSVDGHLASGSFAFGVGATPPATRTSNAETISGSSPVSAAAIAARWILYGGLVVLLGAAFAGAVIFPTPPRVTLVLVAVGWLAALLGSAAVVWVQVADAGIRLTEVLGTSLGVGLLLRAAALLVAGTLIVILVRLGRPNRSGLTLIGIAAAAMMLADVATSHAAASGAVAYNIGVQWLHVVASGTWIGGLLALLLGLRGVPGAETARIANRFAMSATVGIGLVSLTGVLRALSEIGSIENLAITDFGRLLVAKSALLLILAGLGALNHFFNVPAAGRTLRPLRRTGSKELIVAGTVLLLSASLVNLAPPAQAAASASAPAAIVAVGNDFGTTLRIRLSATPGTAGFNTFRATLTDYDTGAPLTDRKVTLRFTLPARPDVGPSQLRLLPAGDGTYQATGANLSLDGAWHLTALVAGPGSSTEVDLLLTARPAQQPIIDVNAVPGLPTIYTVHLGEGRTVQVYLDPGKTGANEAHLTFFDSAGKELPVPNASLSIGLDSQSPVQPTVRVLEPGHFVADVKLSTGVYTVSFSGTAPDSETLSAQVKIPVSR